MGIIKWLEKSWVAGRFLTPAASVAGGKKENFVCECECVHCTCRMLFVFPQTCIHMCACVCACVCMRFLSTQVISSLDRFSKTVQPKAHALPSIPSSSPLQSSSCESFTHKHSGSLPLIKNKSSHLQFLQTIVILLHIAWMLGIPVPVWHTSDLFWCSV